MRKFGILALAIGAAFGSQALAAQEKITLRGAEQIGGFVEPVIINKDPSQLQAPRDWQPGDPIKEMPLGLPKGWVPPVPDARPIDGDPLLDQQLLFGGQSGGASFDTPIINIDGSGFTGVNPSDTVGDVGNDYYIQMINNGSSSRVLIVDKTDGATVQDFVLDALAAGSGTNCGAGTGDPILNFDETVDNGAGQPTGRWVLTEFTNNSLCFYISQTSDPTTGTWFLYEFGSVSGGLPDYPKYAVWPDAYYVGANENQPNTRTYAFDRENMLIGATARPAQSFLAPGLPGFGFQHLMPVDWDGDLPPPAGAPGIFTRHRDDEVHDAGNSNPNADVLELWEFDVDWNTPANSSLSGPTNVPMAEFDSNFCNLIFSGCLAQPGSGTTLFALLQPIMWRAQYRNFGSHQSLVASLATDVSTDISGVRWFELRNTGAGWTNFQEGTVATTDDVSRWMSSAAMDETGNIVVGYNIVGDITPPVFPGMRYSGRLISDPLGTMPRGEVNIISGSSPNSSIRYGDYTALTVDPVDGCTFWYTAQYNATTSWSTRMASFKFDACGEPGFAIGGDVEASVCTLGGSAPYQYTLDVFQINGFTNPVTFSFNPALPTGITGSFSPNPVTPPGTLTINGSVNTSVSPGTNTLTVNGTAASATDRTLPLTLNVFTDIPGPAIPTVPANGADLVPLQPTLEWTPGAQPLAFILEVDDNSDFSSIEYTAFIDDGSTSHTVGVPLTSSTRYFWRIRTSNECGEEGGSEVRNFTTEPLPGDCPVNAVTNITFDDDIEGGINGWTSEGTQDTWAQSTARSFSGATSWNAEDLPSISDQRLISPPLTLPGPTELPISLVYQNWQQIERQNATNCWDGAILEISTDDGATWTQLDAELLTDPYDGVINDFTGGPNPLANLQGWCGDPEDWTRSVVDLDAFAGQTVRIGFRLGTDGTVGREGWYIDDVQVQSCTGGSEVILADGFEDL
ncbi:MAG: hypothetical protein Tsb002_28780 [Wenzhouxiangellaceae bacterium]